MGKRLSRLPRSLKEEAVETAYRSLALIICRHGERPCSNCLFLVRPLLKPIVRSFYLSLEDREDEEPRSRDERLGAFFLALEKEARCFSKAEGKLIRLNSAQCLICKQVLESEDEAVKTTCNCGSLTISGGYRFLFRKGPFKELSITEEL